MKEVAKIEKIAASRLSVTGVLVFSNVAHARDEGRALLRGMPEAHIDLTGVTHADSSALALLLDWQRQAQARKIPFTIENMPQKLLAAAKVCGLDSVLNLADNRYNQPNGTTTLESK